MSFTTMDAFIRFIHSPTHSKYSDLRDPAIIQDLELHTWCLNKAGVYSKEASNQGNTVHSSCLGVDNEIHGQLAYINYV